MIDRFWHIVIILFFINCQYEAFGQNLNQFIPYDKIPVNQNAGDLPQPWIGGLNSAQFNQADLDGDGVEELILLDRNSKQIHVFTWENDSYISQPDFLRLLPELNTEWVIFADYDCDGRKDIFNYITAGIIVYRNISSGPDTEWEVVADPLRTVGFSGLINLVVNAADIPAIDDVDGDGDLDILSYNFALGEDIRFNQNMSVEKTGNCSGLDFEITDRLWGQFKECDCHIYAFDGQTCAEASAGRVAHVGGKCLVTYNMDNDQDKDLFLSHSDCDDLSFFENVGAIDSPYFASYTHDFPNDISPVSMPIYPIVNFLDMTRDGNVDMMAAPNIDFTFEFRSDFSNSIWLYENVGTVEDKEFRLTKKGFLQDLMIDLGELSQPLLFDFDADGDKDLFIAANGKKVDSNFYGYVALYENIGNRFNPSFRLVEEDFLELSSFQLNVPKIRITDLNKDGKKDFFFSGYHFDDGAVRSYVFFNQAESHTPVFDPFDFQELNLPLTIFESPEFYDVNFDQNPDLLVGSRDGALKLYENKGNLNFELIQSDYLGIGRDFTLTKRNVFPLVTDYDLNGRMDMVIADSKELTVYYDFLNNSAPEFDVIKTYNSHLDSEYSISMQLYNSVEMDDLFGTDFKAIVLGGSGGGLRLYRNKYEVDNPDKISFKVTLYPNPVSKGKLLNIESFEGGNVKIYNLWGQQVSEYSILEKSVTKIDISPFASGVYVLFFRSDSNSVSTSKLIINR